MNTIDNYIERLKATMKEYEAKAARLDAQERLRYDKWRGNMQGQFDAIGDWTEAAWDEFAAEAEQQWHDTVIAINDGSKE